MHALTSNELTIFLLAVGLMLLLARFLSKTGHQFNIPTLVAELLAGIILGPTLLGFFLPETHTFFFPESGHLGEAYDTLFNLCVVMLLFIAGLELDFKLLTKQTKAIIITSIFAISIPFISGVWFAEYYFDFLNGIELSAAPFIFPLTFGTIISISALPIITRILMGHKILNTTIGAVIMGVALITDLIGWFGYSSILVYANATLNNIHILYIMLYIVAFFIIVFLIASRKNLMQKIFSEPAATDSEPAYDLAMLFGICLLTAAFTNAIHIHSSLGAFIAGIVFRKIIGDHNILLKQLDVFIMNFFAPIFFISIGLKLNFIENFNTWLVLVVFAFATITKLAGGYLGARLGGIQSKPAWAVGFCLNARGAMEIIMGALALKIGLIGPQLFVAIIIVAIVTCFLAEFALIRILNLHKSLPVPVQT